VLKIVAGLSHQDALSLLAAAGKPLRPTVPGDDVHVTEEVIRTLIEACHELRLSHSALAAVEERSFDRLSVKQKQSLLGLLNKNMTEVALKDVDQERTVSRLIKNGVRQADLLPLIILVLRNEDEQILVRTAAASAIGSIGPEAWGAVHDLRSALLDEREPLLLRQAAAVALGRIGPAAYEAVPSLVVVLRDDSLLLRRNAAEALGLIGSMAHDAVIGLVAALSGAAEDSETDEIIIQAIKGIGRVAVPGLATVLRKERGRVRATAAEILARMGWLVYVAESDLEVVIKDNDLQPEVKDAAADALRQILAQAAARRSTARSSAARLKKSRR
jgi:HEAT repeat protein